MDNIYKVVIVLIATILCSIFNGKAESILSLDIRSSIADTIQLYYDHGSGFSEKNSIRELIKGSGEFERIEFSIPNGNIKAIRLDPLTKAGSVEIATILFKTKDTSIQIPLQNIVTNNQFSKSEIRQGLLYLESKKNAYDPQTYILDVIFPHIDERMSITAVISILFTLLGFLFYITQKDKLKIYRKWLNAVMLVLFGGCLLTLRNPDPFLHPVIYAEDGVWCGKGLSEGWLSAMLWARTDYLVIGNIALLFIAAKTSLLLYGNPLAYLPQSIAIISNIYYSLIAVITYYALRHVCSKIQRAIIFMFILMFPLGNSQNEIIGRILQIGFFFPFLCTLLLYIRQNVQSVIKKKTIDAILVLGMATNPLIFALAGIYLIADAINKKDIKQVIEDNILLITSIFVLGAFVGLKMVTKCNTQLEGFNSNAVIEAVCARSILFPFIFPWYTKTNNILSLILCSIWAFVIIFCYKNTQNNQAKRLMIYLVFGFIITLITTLVMRPGLTTLLDGYKITFPDRYYMGINVFSITLILVGLFQINTSAHFFWRIVANTIILVIMSIYLCNLGLIFELQESKFPIMKNKTFHDQIIAAAVSKHSRIVVVDINPEQPQWSMKVPLKWVSLFSNSK